MRLFDAISQRGFSWADCDLLPVDSEKLREDIRQIPIRYILDGLASEACNNLLVADGLFDNVGELLRFPASVFWLELWSDSASEADKRQRKIGALIEADEKGRCGTATHFFEDAAGEPRMIPIRTFFNFDEECPPSQDPTHLTVKHRDFHHLESVFRHVRLVVDDRWFNAAMADDNFPLQRRLKEYAEGMWFDLPVALAFSAMLNSAGVTKQNPSQLGKLNNARIRRGKAPLLDHVEVSLNLSHSSEHAAEGVGTGLRSPPRLHFVRGHMVSRGSKTFWRASHLRGDNNFALVSRTVKVTAIERRAAMK